MGQFSIDVRVVLKELFFDMTSYFFVVALFELRNSVETGVVNDHQREGSLFLSIFNKS